MAAGALRGAAGCRHRRAADMAGQTRHISTAFLRPKSSPKSRLGGFGCGGWNAKNTSEQRLIVAGGRCLSPLLLHGNNGADCRNCGVNQDSWGRGGVLAQPHVGGCRMPLFGDHGMDPGARLVRRHERGHLPAERLARTGSLAAAVVAGWDTHLALLRFWRAKVLVPGLGLS